MNWYVITLRALSPLATPLQGDTVWGHICWGILDHEGEQNLHQFLDAYKASVPLALSDGFPAGMLPMPALAPWTPEGATDVTTLHRLKKLKRQRYLAQERLLSGTPLSVQSLLAETGAEQIKETDKHKLEERAHNTINRITGRTLEEGGFFSSTEIWPVPGARYEIYAVGTISRERLQQLISWGLETGYGADTSTGKGALAVDNVSPWTPPQQGNRCLALGQFVPMQAGDVPDLRADTLTKYPKLGRELALAGNPFKKPLVLYKAGATFRRSNDTQVAGCLLENVHSRPEIRHHALAPVISYQEEDADGD